MVGARFDRARELRQRDYRDVQLARDALQPTGDLRNLLHSILGAATAHQLQVIDDQHVQAMFRLQSSRLTAELHETQPGRVVDVYLRLRQAAEGARDTIPLV